MKVDPMFRFPSPSLSPDREKEEKKVIQRKEEREITPSLAPALPYEEHAAHVGCRTVNAISKHPAWTGRRLVIFDWMVEDMMRVLGCHTNAFDLHAWFYALDAKASGLPYVIPRREQWAWIQAELLAEAEKRGLPIATAPSPHRNPTAGQKVQAMIAQIDTMGHKEGQS